MTIQRPWFAFLHRKLGDERLRGNTNLTFGILLRDLRSPGPRSRTTVENPAWSRNWGEDQPIVKHHVKDAMQVLESLDFVLENLVRLSRGTQGRERLTSSTGPKYTPFSTA